MIAPSPFDRIPVAVLQNTLSSQLTTVDVARMRQVNRANNGTDKDGNKFLKFHDPLAPILQEYRNLTITIKAKQIARDKLYLKYRSFIGGHLKSLSGRIAVILTSETSYQSACFLLTYALLAIHKIAMLIFPCYKKIALEKQEKALEAQKIDREDASLMNEIEDLKKQLKIAKNMLMI